MPQMASGQYKQTSLSPTLNKNKHQLITKEKRTYMEAKETERSQPATRASVCLLFLVDEWNSTYLVDTNEFREMSQHVQM